MKPTTIIHNVQTGEIIERDMTDEEIAELELARAVRPQKETSTE